MRIKSISLILLAAIFVLGQILLLAAGKPMAGGILSGLALITGYFLLARPSLTQLSKGLAMLSLTAAVLAQATVRSSPQAGLGLFVLSALLLFLARPEGQSLFAAGELNPAPAAFQAWEPWFFLFLTVLSFATRFYLLGDIPQGCVGQEGDLVGHYQGVMETNHYMPHTVDYGNMHIPSLTVYQGALWAKWFGWSAEHLRFPSALWSAVSILVLYLGARAMTSAGPAAIAALLFAASPLQLSLSRIYFPYSILFVPVILGLGLFILGLRRPRWYYFALAGAAAGLALHGYDPGRGVFLIFLAWQAWLWLFYRRSFPAWKHIAWFWGGFVLIGSPTIYHALTQWSNYWSYAQLHANANRGQGLGAYIRYLWGNLPIYAKMFHVRSDMDYSLLLGRDPILDPMTGVLFGTGFFLAACMFWRPVPFFLLLYLAAGLMPAMLTSGYAHPTVRRACMALPAIYLFAALALERLRLVWNSGRSRWLAPALGLIGLAAAGWSVYQGLDYYFVRFAHHPGTRSNYYYRVYQAAREVRLHPRARVHIQENFLSIHVPVLFARNFSAARSRTLEELLDFNSNQDQLLLLESYMEATLPFWQAHFPHARVKVFREDNMAAPICSEPFFYYLATEPYNPAVYLVSVLLPAQDVKAFQTLVQQEPGRPAERLDVFAPGFSRAQAGRKLRLQGALLTHNGESLAFRLDWPGWELRIDGQPLAWGRAVILDGGIHYVELVGNVPRGQDGALPLQARENGTEVSLAGRLVAILPSLGARLRFMPGKDSWNLQPALTRQELFPLKRFYDVTDLPCPFTVRMSALLAVPTDGTYEFYMKPFAGCRLEMDGQGVFDNFVSRESPVLNKIFLKAGKPVALEAFYQVDGPLLNRTLMVFYRGPDSLSGAWVPLEWFRLPVAKE